MSLCINESTIYLTRGDTARIEINIWQGQGEDARPYEMQDGDSLRFALKTAEYVGVRYRELKNTEPLIIKDINPETKILELDPEDTKSLGFGDYLYDIELTMADGTVDTFIADADFVLTTEVH